MRRLIPFAVLTFLLVPLVATLSVTALAAPKGAPEGPLPAEGISCLSFELDGGQLYHQDFERPLHTWKEIRAAAKQFGVDLKLRGAITGEPRVKSDADRIIAAVEGKSGGAPDYEVGNVCYVLMRYCAPGCTGQGCVTVRAPSIR